MCDGTEGPIKQVGKMDKESLGQTILESVREPLLALDERFAIQFASGSFHRSFQISPSSWIVAHGIFLNSAPCLNDAYSNDVPVRASKLAMNSQELDVAFCFFISVRQARRTIAGYLSALRT